MNIFPVSENFVLLFHWVSDECISWLLLLITIIKIKHFKKQLEKEAVATGTPLGQAHDIDIPPPRPKKKPNYPYPRKTGFSTIPPATEADGKTLKTMNPLPQEINTEASVAAEPLQQTKECSDDAEAHRSVILNLLQDAPSASIPSSGGGSKNQSGFREYVPSPTQPKEPSSLKGSSLTVEVINMESTSNGITDSDQNIGRTSGINMALSASSGGQNQPKKQSEAGHEATFENGDSPSSANPLFNHAIPAAPAFHTCSAMSYISHPFPTFPPLAQLPNAQEFYRSFPDMPTTLSREIASALLQNPAVHAAACMAAASLWPSEEMYSPSMAALVAATVAAASAWWATNGLVSFPPPIHASGFAISPPATSFPMVNSGQAPQEKVEEGHETCQDSSTADQQAVVLSSSSSSNLEEIKKTLSDFKPLSDAAHHNLDGEKIRKHDRSSCGSNTTSSSEIETDAALKKNGETKDEVEEAHSQNLPAGEACTRRARSNLFFTETWKEVSQQGRLAFQALFTRDSLPQSFATQHAKPEMELPEGVVPIGRDQITQNCSRPNEIKHGNLKVRRTGFKPYKRCAAEVEVHKKSSTHDETSNKRIRVQGEVSS